MKLRYSKKASISLSINAIVVIVIAFVVLGLALTLTRTIFSGALGKIPEALDLTKLESQPSAENPISISDTVIIKTGDSVTLSIGYYNRWSDTATDAEIGIMDCESPTVIGIKQPDILSPKQNVPASESKGYKLILTAAEGSSKIDAGTYICRVIAFESGYNVRSEDEPGNPSSNQLYEDKQIFLKVTS